MLGVGVAKHNEAKRLQAQQAAAAEKQRIQAIEREKRIQARIDDAMKIECKSVLENRAFANAIVRQTTSGPVMGMTHDTAKKMQRAASEHVDAAGAPSNPESVRSCAPKVDSQASGDTPAGLALASDRPAPRGLSASVDMPGQDAPVDARTRHCP